MERLNEREQLSYCGLYCGGCPMYTREISQTAKKLAELTALAGFDQMAEFSPDMEWYKEFKNRLDWLKKEVVCDGCRSHGKKFHEGCELSHCCSGKKVEFCHQCEGTSCTTMEGFKAQSPFFEENLRRIQEIGVEAFIQEQKRAGLPSC